MKKNKIGFKLKEDFDTPQKQNEFEESKMNLTYLVQKHKYNYKEAVEEQRKYLEFLIFSQFKDGDSETYFKIIDDYKTIVITEHNLNNEKGI